MWLKALIFLKQLEYIRTFFRNWKRVKFPPTRGKRIADIHSNYSCKKKRKKKSKMSKRALALALTTSECVWDFQMKILAHRPSYTHSSHHGYNKKCWKCIYWLKGDGLPRNVGSDQTDWGSTLWLSCAVCIIIILVIAIRHLSVITGFIKNLIYMVMWRLQLKVHVQHTFSLS